MAIVKDCKRCVHYRDYRKNGVCSVYYCVARDDSIPSIYSGHTAVWCNGYETSNASHTFCCDESWIDIKSGLLPKIGDRVEVVNEFGDSVKGTLKSISINDKGTYFFTSNCDTSRASRVEKWRLLAEKNRVELEDSHCLTHDNQLRYGDSIYCLGDMSYIDAQGLRNWINLILSAEDKE